MNARRALLSAGWSLIVSLPLIAACSNPPESSGSPGPPTGHTSEASAKARVAAAVDQFIAGDKTGSSDDVRAILVLTGGRPLVERYYHSSADATSNVASVTKSVMSILVGIALDEGDLRGLDQTLAQLLPHYAKTMTPKVAGITLRQVLTMTAGLPADDPKKETPYIFAKDWVGAIVSGGLEQAPGQGFAYSSAGSHLLSAIIGQATGRRTLDFARDKLFGPLGINTEPAAEPLFGEKNRAVYQAASFAWPVDPQGHNLGDALLKISAPDMEKLGQLMLTGGRWGGKQIVSKQWVTASTRAQVATGGANQENATEQYGYQWWITHADGRHAFAACGFGGQLIEVVPSLDLVVVVSSTIPDNPRLTCGHFLDLVNLSIAPVLTR
jgi:CubicO group peptidase (beta-lactamase class C family)